MTSSPRSGAGTPVASQSPIARSSHPGALQDAAGHFADALRLCDEWGAPAWALRTIGDWLVTGVPAPDRAELVNRGLALANELGLPGVAARIADEAQIITP